MQEDQQDAERGELDGEVIPMDEDVMREGEEAEEEIDPGMQDDAEEWNRRWKEFVNGANKMRIRTLTMSIPIDSKKAKDVVPAVSRVYSRLRSLRIPVLRVHTDRGREFMNQDMAKWIADRDLWRTTTAADEPNSNARAEAEVQMIKRRVRTLMAASGAPKKFWPLAARHASEERFRAQLAQCGVPTPKLIAFGKEAMAKRKWWQDRSGQWRSPRSRCGAQQLT